MKKYLNKKLTHIFLKDNRISVDNHVLKNNCNLEDNSFQTTTPFQRLPLFQRTVRLSSNSNVASEMRLSSKKGWFSEIGVVLRNRDFLFNGMTSKILLSSEKWLLAGLGTAFFPVQNVLFFPTLLKNVPFFFGAFGYL